MEAMAHRNRWFTWHWVYLQRGRSTTNQWLMITLWLFNIAMENGPFIDGLPIKNGDFPWRTVSHNQMVYATLSVTKSSVISMAITGAFPSYSWRFNCRLWRLVPLETRILSGFLVYGYGICIHWYHMYDLLYIYIYTHWYPFHANQSF